MLEILRAGLAKPEESHPHVKQTVMTWGACILKFAMVSLLLKLSIMMHVGTGPAPFRTESDDNSSEPESARVFRPVDDIVIPPHRFALDWMGFPWCFFPNRGPNHPDGWAVVGHNLSEGTQYWIPLDYRWHEYNDSWWSWWRPWLVVIGEDCARFLKRPPYWWWHRAKTSHDTLSNNSDNKVFLETFYPPPAGTPVRSPRVPQPLEECVPSDDSDNPHWEELRFPA